MNPAAKAKARILGRGPFGFSRRTWPFVKVLVGNWLFALVFYATAKATITWQPTSWFDAGDRLALIAKCAVFAVLPALVAVAVVAAQRLNPDNWVGQKVKPNSSLDINTRFILNTIEQFILYFVGQAALCIYAPIYEARTMPILTALFVLGRILFWIGYHKNPYLRAFGFGLTFYPTCVVYIWLLVMMIFGVRLPF